MNDTNNSNENNINSVPVQGTSSVVPSTTPEPVAVQPAVQPVVPAQVEQNVQPSAVEQPAAQVEVPVDTSQQDNVGNNGEEVKNDVTTKTQEEVRNAKLRFPFIVSILLVVFIILFVVYYFVFTTPKKMFTKLLTVSVDRIVNLIDYTNSSDEFTNTDINVTLDTKSVDFDSKNEFSYFDNLTYKINFNRDNKNKNFEFKLRDNLDTLSDKESFTFNKTLNSNMYYMGSNIYAKPGNDFIAVRSKLGSSEEDTVFTLVAEYLNEVIGNINLEKVTRGFATKKVNNQTLLAMKYSLDYNNTDLQKLNENVVNNILDTSKHPEFIKKFANLVDMDEKVVIDLIKSVNELSKDTESLKLNYYTNISFTNLICLEMITDSGVFSLCYLNDYYFITFKSNSEKDIFDLDLAFNFNNLDLFGTILIDNDNTYSRITFDSKYEIDNKTYKLSKNTINALVYDSKDAEKPYMGITINMSHGYDEKIIKEDSIKSINREDASSEDIAAIEYIKDKTSYELTYLYILLGMNKVSENPKDIINNIINNDNNNDNNNVESDDNASLPEIGNDANNSSQVSTPSE